MIKKIISIVPLKIISKQIAQIKNNRWFLNFAFVGSHRNSLSDCRPWLTFGALRFLDKIISRDMRIYEYGSGGSTLYFAKRCSEVFSAEHDIDWYRAVLGRIEESGYAHCKIYLYEPETDLSAFDKEFSDPDGYISSDKECRGMSFRKYASSIDVFSDCYFDIILIDGRARPSCFKHAVRKIRNGGFLILDNSDIPHYSFIRDTLRNSGWDENNFYGNGPYLAHSWQTSVWRKSV